MNSSLTPRFQLSDGIGYLDGEYKRLEPGVEFTIDNKLPNVADWQANLSAAYRFELASGKLTARLDYSYSDGYFVTSRNQILTPSYDVFNGALVYTPNSGDWEIALQGRNLTDEFYSDRVTTNSPGGFLQTLAPPRELIGRFTYRF